MIIKLGGGSPSLPRTIIDKIPGHPHFLFLQTDGEIENYQLTPSVLENTNQASLNALKAETCKRRFSGEDKVSNQLSRSCASSVHNLAYIQISAVLW